MYFYEFGSGILILKLAFNGLSVRRLQFNSGRFSSNRFIIGIYHRARRLIICRLDTSPIRKLNLMSISWSSTHTWVSAAISYVLPISHAFHHLTLTVFLHLILARGRNWLEIQFEFLLKWILLIMDNRWTFNWMLGLLLGSVCV